LAHKNPLGNQEKFFLFAKSDKKGKGILCVAFFGPPRISDIGLAKKFVDGPFFVI
jgi:hypothetical protein